MDKFAMMEAEMRADELDWKLEMGGDDYRDVEPNVCHDGDGMQRWTLKNGFIRHDKNGEWVKHDIAEELYEVVSELACYTDSIVPNTLIELAEKVLKKARGEGE